MKKGAQGPQGRSHQQEGANYQPEVETMHYTPLKVAKSQILKEVYHICLLKIFLHLQRELGPLRDEWCEFHRTCGHITKNCHILKNQIEKLIQDGYLLKEGTALGGKGVGPWSMRKAKTRIDQSQGGKTPSQGDNSYHIRRKRDFEDVNVKVEALWLFRNGRAREGDSATRSGITFLDEDYEGTMPYQDDPMEVLAIIVEYKVERKLGLPKSDLEEYPSTLIGFIGETTFRVGPNAKTIIVKFTIINARTSYNIILGWSVLNRLHIIVSTTHLCMKYLIGSRVGVVETDQHMARRCYEARLKVRGSKGRWKAEIVGTWTQVHFLDLDPCLDQKDIRSQLGTDLKEVQICLKTKVGRSLDVKVEEQLIRVLTENWDMFAWSPKNMLGIDTNFLYHRLSITLGIKKEDLGTRSDGCQRKKQPSFCKCVSYERLDIPTSWPM
ncbi:hypothetical protein CR513_14147, partial [Mucuna pruriens]